MGPAICGMLGLAIIGAACTLAPLPTPAPSTSPTPTPQPTPLPTPAPTPTATEVPSPDSAAIPGFSTGEIISTVIPGMRVRRQPATDSLVETGLLPVGAELQVVMGPIVNDGFGWYLATDADPADPAFSEGWIAAGYRPDPFLGHSPRQPAADDPYVAGLAGTGNAEQGPIPIPDDQHAIRWLALDPERRACTFSVSLAPPAGQPIPAIRATIGGTIVPGTLQPSYFTGQPSLRGDLFMSVESDCSWALAVIRVVPQPLPSG